MNKPILSTFFSLLLLCLTSYGQYEGPYKYSTRALVGIVEDLSNRVDGIETSISNVFLKDGSVKATGDFDLDGNKVRSLGDPISDDDAVHKRYVDSGIAGLFWKPSVIAITNNPPVTTNSGDRYLIDSTPSGIFVGHENKIASYTTNWSFTMPSNSCALFVDNIKIGYVYDATATNWVPFSGATTYEWGAGLGNTGNYIYVKTSDGIIISNDNVRVDRSVVDTWYAGLLAFVGLSNRFDIVETNYAQLPDFLNLSNRVVNVETSKASQVDLIAVSNLTDTAWQNPDCATNYTWITNANGCSVTLTSYKEGSPANVIIPDIINGMPVTACGIIFASNTTITNVVGNCSISTIETGAFFACTGLKSVSFNQVLTIEDEGFYLVGLESVNFPNVRNVGINAFSQTSLTTVSLPLVTNLGNSCFINSVSLTECIIPKIISIGNLCFNNTAINNIDCKSVEFVGEEAFASTFITSIVFNSVISFGTDALSRCEALTAVYYNVDTVPIMLGPVLFSQSTNVTNYVLNPTSTGWSNTFAGMPVVRSPVLGPNIVTTNSTGQLNFTGADILIANGTKTNNPITKSQFDTKTGAQVGLYADTNVIFRVDGSNVYIAAMAKSDVFGLNANWRFSVASTNFIIQYSTNDFSTWTNVTTWNP
jgi:hypothetical protein